MLDKKPRTKCMVFTRVSLKSEQKYVGLVIQELFILCVNMDKSWTLHWVFLDLNWTGYN